MRPKILSTHLVLLIFLFIGVSQALASFEDGLSASKNGDYTRAMREFRSLAEHGHADAQVQLGIMYEMGLGVKKNYSEAAKWYQKAAINGESSAHKRLLEMKKRGLNSSSYPPVPENFEGNLKEPQIQYDIGVMYYKGIGVDSDPDIAYRWFCMAANQGHAKAQNDMAVMLSKGIGTKQDSSEAYVWFLKAAEQGYEDSQFNLGLLLSTGEGKGMPQHFSLAYMWFEIAAQNGILEARNKQVSLTRLMKESQIESAKNQAREWLFKHSTH